MFPSLRALVCALLMTVCTFAIAADGPRDTIASRLRADLQSGRISDDDAVLYAAVAITNPRLLPERYRAPMDREAMELVAILYEKLSAAHPDVRATVRYLLSPPNGRTPVRKPDLAPVLLDDASVAQRAVASASTGERAVDLSAHFEITYTIDVTPYPIVEIVRISLERAYATYAAAGFHMPAAPTDGLIDVVIMPNPCPVPEFEFDCGNGGIAIPPGASNVFQGGDGDPLILLRSDILDENSLRTLTAHELFHQVQYQMSGFLQVFYDWWVLEGQAEAMEDVAEPLINSYIFSVQQFYAGIDRTLTDHSYPAATFWKFLMERYSGNDPSIIRQYLFELRNNTAKSALRTTLAARGPLLQEAMQEFTLWNLFGGERFESGYYDDAIIRTWPTLTRFASEFTLSKPGALRGSRSLHPLSGQYVRVLPGPALTRAHKVRITVNTSFGSPGELRGWIVHRRRNGTNDIRKLPDVTKVREVVDDFSFVETKEIVLVLSNGHADNARTSEYIVELVPPQDIAFCMDTTGSMGGSIFALRSTATRIMNDLVANDADFRIAITEFKDFPSFPYGWGGDYPYRADSPFSNDPAVITGGISMLFASGGGDWPESQLSGVLGAINAQGIGPWRSGVKKSIIVMTDAPGHDPEPFTGYTKTAVAAAANAGGVTVSEMPAARFRIGTLAESVPETPIAIYGVVVGGDFMAFNQLNALATATGGRVWQTSYDPTDIAAALLEALGEIGGGTGEEPPPPPTNRAPEVSGAMADPSRFWPPNGKLVDVRVTNVTDPDGDPVTLTITGISQDEPVTSGRGKGEPDAGGIGTALAQIRAERDGGGNGRVYTISFTATDGRGGSSNGTVTVCVPHDQGGNTVCTDEGPLYDSMTF